MKLVSQITDRRDVVSKEYVDYVFNSRFLIVEKLPELDEALLSTIYLIKENIGSPTVDDYTEYIVIEFGSPTQRKWEILGKTSIDLSDYVKKENILTDLRAKLGTVGVLKSDNASITASALRLSDFTAQTPNCYITTGGQGALEASALTLDKFITTSPSGSTQFATLDEQNKVVKRKLTLSDFIGFGTSQDEGKFLKINNNGNVVFGNITWEEYSNN